MINQFRYSEGQFTISFEELLLRGTDVVSFLDSQTTYKISLLTPEHFHLVSFLDPQGKVETYGWLVNKNDHFLYLIPKSLKEKSLARLNRFLVSEDVEILEQGIRSWTFTIGGEERGLIFDEPAILSPESSPGLPVIPETDVELWRKLNGWPSFDGSDFSSELVNNLRLFDLAVVMNKGCYPGQETVSKIATHRGAAYSPVLVETNASLPAGTLTIEGNRIGTAMEALPWDGKYFVITNLLRDFRVEGMKITFDLNGESHHGIVRYYPLLPGNKKAKALELYDRALSLFRDNDLSEAESLLKKSLELDPSHADTYEALGVMLGRQNRYPEAIDLMERLVKVDPDSLMAHTNLSLFLMKIGKIEEAENHKSLATLKSFSKFGNEAKEKELAAQKAKADAAEWARREKMFLEVLDIDPEDSLANYGLGSLAVERGEWAKAREHLERVLREDPKYSVAYLALGKAYKGLGLLNEARETFRTGIKVAAGKGDLMPANQMQSELERI